MLVTGVRKIQYGSPAHEHYAGASTQSADARISPALRGQLTQQTRNVLRMHGEAQLVVVATSERKLACATLP